MRTNTLERNLPAGTKSLFTRLAVPLFLLCLSLSAHAEDRLYTGKVDSEFDEAFEEEFLLLEEEQTVVSASRHAQKKSLSPSAITVITREQIASSGALSIPDLLRRVPGIDTVVASPYFTGITARLPHTYENNQFLVLIDGRQANIELLGQAPWESQPISIEDIERIEVIRGPGSALYGANAFAGVVSIFTRALPEKDSAWVQVEGGQWDRLRASARGSVRKGSWAGALSAEYDRAGTFGNQRLTAKEAWKARILCEWRSGDHKLVFDAGFVDSSGYIPTSIGHVTGSFFTATARAAYSSKNLASQLYYVSNIFDGNLTIPLVFKGLHLADFKPAKAITHNADGEIQWTLPSFWKPLMIIAGGRARLSWFGCPNCLDSDFANPESPRYHQEGTSYLELRAGGFVHAELTPLDALALNGSLRADFNTATGFFLSPRLAAVFEVAERHHLRISVARAFRKPSFLEKGLHVDVEFPTDSAIVPADRMLFREFLSRVIGNPDLGNEKLWAFELGYQWRPAPFFVELDLYTNLYSDFSWVQSRIVTDSRGLPDLRRSSFRFEKADYSTVIMGAELQFGWNATDWLRLELALATFGVWQNEFDVQEDGSPKLLFSLGAEWNHPLGIRGSLFLSGRSEFQEHNIENPAGLLEPTLSMKVANSLLIQGRIGWTTEVGNTTIEAGSKLYVPFTIDPRGWGMYDRAGGVTPEGRLYGGTILLPTLLFYLSAEY